ncbi:MAG TPA: GNAT family N-acetyltransferase [Candidatus Limnocylindria bacterium]|nr:GNAT family N-acetyltransferase [Candidatus Limnocylindria bacterium]
MATEGARLIGWGWLRDLRWPIGALMLSLDVIEDRRREGIGSRLLGELSAAATGSADEIATRVAEESEAGVFFARARGFVERYRLYEFVLDLETYVDVEPLSTDLDRLGIQLTTLAAHDSEELRRDLYALFIETVADVPTPDPPPATSYEQWEAEMFGLSTGDEISVLATHEQRPVAICHLSVSGETAWTEYTGVARGYRGRGLALAVKREGIRLAHQRGVRFIRTENDTLNRAMIAINERLGFRRRPGRIRFGRPL